MQTPPPRPTLWQRWAKRLVWALFPQLEVKIELQTGLKAVMHTHADLKMLQEVFCEQGYRDFIEAIDAPVVCWIDAGANCGLFSLYLENWARQKGWQGPRRAVLIEPNRYALAPLKRSLELSGLTQNWQVEEAALADRRATVEFYESAVAYKDSIFAARKHRKRQVPAVDLEALLAQLGGQVDVIKIDIEGAEKMALEAWGPVWARARHLIVEWHEPYCSCRQIDGILAPLGYQRRLTKPGYGVDTQGRDVADVPMGVALWSR